jgi:hypothetical protein
MRAPPPEDIEDIDRDIPADELIGCDSSAWAGASRGIPFWDSPLDSDGLRCEPEARFALAEAETRELLHELQPASYWVQTLLCSAQERPASFG